MGSEVGSPNASALRAIRETWLEEALPDLEGAPGVLAAGFVGSLGRGDHDDWSDVDLLVVVPDDPPELRHTDPRSLPGSRWLTLGLDTRHNAPLGVGSVSGQYVIEGLPLHLAAQEHQPPTPKSAAEHELMRLGLIPQAAKQIVRRSANSERMVAFVGGPYAPDASPAEQLGSLRQLLDRPPEGASPESLVATAAYLDLAAGHVAAGEWS